MADDLSLPRISINNRAAFPARGTYADNAFHLLQVDERLSVDELRGRIHGALVGNNYDEAILRTDDNRLFVLYDRKLPTTLRPGTRVTVAGETMTVVDVDWVDSTSRSAQRTSHAGRGAATGAAAGAVLGNDPSDVVAGAVIGGLLGAADNNHAQVERMSPPRPDSLISIRSTGPSTLRGLTPPR